MKLIKQIFNLAIIILIGYTLIERGENVPAVLNTTATVASNTGDAIGNGVVNLTEWIRERSGGERTDRRTRRGK